MEEDKRYSESLLMSEFTENDIKIMAAIVDSYYKSGASVEIKADVDLSVVGETVSSALKQVGKVKKKISSIRLGGRKKAISILKKSLGVVNIQLNVIKDQNTQLRKELSDVRAELSKCLSGKGEEAVTVGTQKVLVESAMKQVKQVEEESNQIDQLVDETVAESQAAVEKASNAVLESDQEAVNTISQAVDDQKDIQAIQTKMEANGDIPTSIPTAPLAPSQPGYEKPQKWRTDDGDEIKVSPLQATPADEVQEDLQETQGDLFDQLKAAVTAREGRLNPEIESEIAEIARAIQARAGYTFDSRGNIQLLKYTLAASSYRTRTTSRISSVEKKTKSVTRKENMDYYHPSPLRRPERKSTSRKNVGSRARPSRRVPRRKPERVRLSDASLMSSLEETEETRGSRTNTVEKEEDAYDVPDAFSVRGQTKQEEKGIKPIQWVASAYDDDGTEEDEDFDIFF